MDLLDQTLFENKLDFLSECIVRWTASGNYYSGRCRVLKINNKSVRVELIEDVQSAMGHFPSGRELIVPMSNDKKWSENNGVFASNAPSSVPRIVVKIGTSEKTFELFRCTAPKAYDYGYVINLMETCKDRIIAIPTENSHYQRARYASGLYTAAPLEMYLVSRCQEMFWEKLHEPHSD